MSRTSSNSDDLMILADEREFIKNDFYQFESSKSPDVTACVNCNCVFIGELYENFVRKRALVKYQSPSEVI